MNKPKFSLGKVVATTLALEALNESNQSPWEFISRHASGDWGEELCDEDRELNEQALSDGSRLLSAYVTKSNQKVWVITEAEDDSGKRAATTVLLPEEY
ncbi:MAG: hypothetical protein HUJ26_00380 [Planctomycetaceae bacterium]|nr:hypothetical protein [Planctomycetaceae bacterium]